MSFNFRYLCELFDTIDGSRANSPGHINVAVHTWFDEHDADIPRHGPGAVAFLSCLFPERRPDRVLGVHEKDLEHIIQRAHCLGLTRMTELQCWRNSDGPDFALAVQRVLSLAESGPRSQDSVTIGEIEQVLNRIASRSPFSSSSLKDGVHQANSEPLDQSNELAAIFRRLHSSSTKWMIRIMFKALSSLELPERLILRRFHFLLPDLLRFQNSFHACVAALENDTIKEMPMRPAQQDESLLRESASYHFTPRLGIMVGLPSRDKARSIGHCCQLARGRTMSVEQKYDGEYCQIHVCLKGSSPQIQIFSKSGRDSTADRANVYGAIVAGLAIGTSQCNFQSTCIMEGELLVWNDSRKQIEPFHKIRKHVRRAGRRLGCARDSPVQEGEHLMVVLYDLLLLDDNICVREPHDRRRQRLRLIVRCIPGRLDIGTRTKIDLGSRGAADRLRRLFAATIARGGEGLVLKGCADPYLCLDDSSRQIKLKKDYIAGLGDTVDFVVVGGRRDARDEAELRMGKLSWTSFYAACLENKDQVRRFDTKPIFRIVARIDQHGVSKSIIRHLNQHGNFCRVPFAHFRNEMEVIIDQKQLRKPTELFKKPFVVELMGAGFDRPADTNYWTLRFPRIQKVHEDRTSKDVVSFVELQELAHECQHLAPENADEAEKVWLARLQSSDQEAQHAGSTESQKTSESSERNESEASLDETRPVENQTRTIRLEVADSQSDSTASSDVVSFKKRIRTESRSEISPPRKRVKRIDPTSQNSANETRMSVASPTGYPTAAAKPCEANTNPPFGQSRIGEAAQESDSTPASQIPRSNLHPQTVRFSADALAFLSKLRTPLLIRDSSRDLFSTLCRSQFDMYQELAISFTFCKRLFIESVLAPRIREASAKGNEPCWHVVVVRLDGHHSFFAEIRTLVAKVEEQHNAAAGDFHILFVDGSLFELLARDESRHWQGAIRGYLRYAAGKVVEITYGVRFSADFLQGIR